MFAIVLPALALGPALPPEHVHESADGQGHAVAHLHFAPHPILVHDGDGREWDHAEESGLVWLVQAMVDKAAFQLSPQVATRYDALDILEPARLSASLPMECEAAAHGPPRQCLSHRGPPPAPLT